MTIISHSKKFIFLHPKKCAGDSISEPLLKYNEGFKCNISNNQVKFNPNYYKKSGKIIDTKNITINELVDDLESITPEMYRDYYIFSVTRNPWDRFVSFISSKSKMDAFMKGGKIIGDIEKRGLIKPIPVTSFITYTGDKTKHRKLNYIIKYEDLQNGFDKVCDDLDIPRFELNHLNKSALRRGRDYRDYYTYPSIKYIENRFQRDIERFKYEF